MKGQNQGFSGESGFTGGDRGDLLVMVVMVPHHFTGVMFIL